MPIILEKHQKVILKKKKKWNSFSIRFVSSVNLGYVRNDFCTITNKEDIGLVLVKHLLHIYVEWFFSCKKLINHFV